MGNCLGSQLTKKTINSKRFELKNSDILENQLKLTTLMQISLEQNNKKQKPQENSLNTSQNKQNQSDQINNNMDISQSSKTFCDDQTKSAPTQLEVDARNSTRMERKSIGIIPEVYEVSKEHQRSSLPNNLSIDMLPNQKSRNQQNVEANSCNTLQQSESYHTSYGNYSINIYTETHEYNDSNDLSEDELIYQKPHNNFIPQNNNNNTQLLEIKKLLEKNN